MAGRQPPGASGPRMPESVLRKQPAQIVAPPPGVITGRLPAPRPAPGRPAFRKPSPRPLPKTPPRPMRGRGQGKPWPIGLIALALLFLGLFVVAMGIGAATNVDLGGLFSGPARNEPPPRAFPVLDPSRPERLTIPAINVEAPILEVGLAADGTVGVPPLKRHNEAGWFDGGPTPGQFGPALIVGHADTRTGPSVFHELPKLKPGQRIEVERADNSVAVFEVNSVEHFDKGKLPVQRVYSDFTRPSLRLMTCGGRWVGGSTGYADNIVVFASLVSAKKT
ncbi:class F sortase [Actinoplanes bogorensis]|uniref:Class F sortase n=1 Tax=Paractinoplanes bogorensis TaxID=1610840 RepID=A0ABS5Z3E9_9ACTN|nr:class F sortase [Actinoplanes bogorensis]MBU2669469.1 class F sortase [Actinoplanes bogorensis]